jgi:branched-chain amino acid transport system ATP-binding protein
VRGLSVRFGGLRALTDVTFRVGRCELVGIMGPNGAGKTTLFHVLSGIVLPTTGRLMFDGSDLTGRAPHQFCRRGVARTFQTPRVFRAMTVLENVMFGLRFARRARAPASLVSSRAHGVARDVAARAALARVGMLDDAPLLAGALPPARQRRLEIAMALATSPRLLLLDEVAAGLTEAEADHTASLIRGIQRELSIAVIWIEHAVGVLMRAVDRMLVLDYGELIADGAPAAVAADRRVIDAYLGAEGAVDAAPHRDETPEKSR